MAVTSTAMTRRVVILTPTGLFGNDPELRERGNERRQSIGFALTSMAAMVQGSLPRTLKE